MTHWQTALQRPTAPSTQQHTPQPQTPQPQTPQPQTPQPQTPQPQTPQQAVPDGASTEILLDPADDLGPLPAAGEQDTPGSSTPDLLGPMEITPDQALTLDDLPRAKARLSEKQKLALLTEYEQADSQGLGTAWLKARGIARGRITDWRRLRETAQLPAGHPLLATRPDYLSEAQKAALVRKYRAAIAQGQDQEWLAAMNLTRQRMTHWQTLLQPPTVPSAQQQTPRQQNPQQAVLGGASTEILLDPVDDLVLQPTAGDQGAPDSAATLDLLGQMEIDPAQAFTLDDLTRAGPKLSEEQKLALLADYEQAAAQGQGTAWLKAQGINSGQISAWRRLRETARIPVGHPQLATRGRHLSEAQKTGLVREFRAAVAQGRDQEWLAAKNLTRQQMAYWQNLLQLPTADGQDTPGSSTPALPGPVGIDPDQLLTLDDLAPANVRLAARIVVPGLISIDRQGSPQPLQQQPAVGDLLDLGRARLDHRERLEDTLSREQDRPRLLLLTEGLAAALEQVAHTLASTEPPTATTADLLATIDLWRRAALDAAGQVVDGLALGAAQNLRLHSLLQDAWGPFGESTWHRLATQLRDLPTQSRATRQAGLAAINDRYATLTRAFHAQVADVLPSHTWFRRPASGARTPHTPTDPGASTSSTPPPGTSRPGTTDAGGTTTNPPTGPTRHADTNPALRLWDAPVPDAPMRDVSMRDVSMPDPWMPDVSMPDPWMPDVSMQDAWMPDTPVPGLARVTQGPLPGGAVEAEGRWWQAMVEDAPTRPPAAAAAPERTGSAVRPGAGTRQVAAGRAAARPGYAEALKVLGEASLSRDEHHSVRVQLRTLFHRGDPVGWPAWGVRPELVGVFPSVPVLAVLRWPHP
ncbi:MAG TPA: hypothetical protein VFP72_12205, partial [Kineosporiaceae bacterium]|nr:hypothetical protein [Kineosporiaceae bacterium]